MAATSIFFNGRLIRRPGSYSEVDTSGLESVGLGASGIVAILGTSEGGRPVASITETVDIQRFSSPERAQKAFRSGNLQEAAGMVFAPSNDPNIQAGAQQFVSMKVNPALQAAATFANASGNSLVVTAADWGEFTNQISVTIQNGTNQGKLVTVTFEDLVEAVDDIGGDSMFTLLYRPATGDPGASWDTMTADVLASGIRTNATKAMPGRDADVLLAETGTFTAVSANAADTTQTIFVLGLDAATPVVRSVVLNGTTPVTVGDFDGGVLGAWLDASAAGNVNVSETGVNLTITAGNVDTGGVKSAATYTNLGDLITLVADAAAAQDLYVVGRTSAGARNVEAVTLNGTTPVQSAANTIVEVEFWGLGAVPAARTITASATALQSANTVQNTLQKQADFFNARQVANTVTPTQPFGFNYTLVTGLTTLDPATALDLTASAVNIDDPVTGSFTADLFFLVQALNNQFSLVNGAASAGAVGVPDNTTSPVFLTGGSEGTTTFQNWQDALNLLKKIRVNTIVVLTGDPAVHAALKSHCEFMGGIGRSERDGFVGLLNATLTDLPTKDEIKTQIVALNSRHIRACAQNIERFNTAGERTTFTSYFQAVLGAGMQAGSPVGTSLTHKLGNALSATQHQSWNPVDDAEELIESGLLFMEEVENIGRRWVRNVTTNVSSSNIAFTEGSVNEAVNFAVFNFRTNLEFAVGRRGFSGTINATKLIANNTLGLLVDQTVITSFRSLQIELVLDVLDVSVEIAPVIPINFVRSVLHLVNPVLQAA